jgi:coenzyme Q-binding protein COQ10
VPNFQTVRRVKHSAAEMFDLVADVESYPRFVPLCERLVIRGRTKVDGTDILVADMTIAYKIIRETFTSRVALDRPGLKISATYLDGPFRHLDNRWSFEPVSAQESVVRFSIDYEFKSRTLGALMGAVFERAFRKFAGAFEARADEIYAGRQPAVAVR